MLLKFLCEKLVRDRTRERYQDQGGELEYRTLDPKEFLRELFKKLLEEAHEVIEAQDDLELASELADVQEVLNTIAEFKGISLKRIEDLRLQKATERGTFSNRIFSSVAIIPQKTPLCDYLLSNPQNYLLIQKEELKHTLEANTGDWKRFFGELKNDIMLSMPEYVVSTFHIGTTALSKTPAQPIVDILAAVTSLLDFDINSKNLMRHGWLGRGENGIKGQRFFVKIDSHNGQEVAHLHCFEYTDAQIKNFLRFTQTLKENPALQSKYTEIRQELLNNSATTTKEYQQGKQQFILATLS